MKVIKWKAAFQVLYKVYFTHNVVQLFSTAAKGNSN